MHAQHIFAPSVTCSQLAGSRFAYSYLTEKGSRAMASHSGDEERRTKDRLFSGAITQGSEDVKTIGCMKSTPRPHIQPKSGRKHNPHTYNSLSNKFCSIDLII